jgi:pyrroline-5-carboxylate reductase
VKANAVIGFLGAGKMATALAQGFLKAGLASPDRIWASDISDAALAAFSNTTGAHAVNSNLKVVEAAEILILAVKPDQVESLQKEVREALDLSRHLVISIAAGLTLGRLEAAMPGTRIVRVMPNTPALVGEGASAYSPGVHASRSDLEIVKRLFESVGTAVEVREKLLDAVTGLSGSGPAYGFLMIEALSDGGVAAGLPRDVATHLAAQTLLGAATMVLKTGRHPGELKDAVCSPGGTTIEAVHELERGGLRSALITAVRAAAAKSRQLGQG